MFRAITKLEISVRFLRSKNLEQRETKDSFLRPAKSLNEQNGLEVKNLEQRETKDSFLRPAIQFVINLKE